MVLCVRSIFVFNYLLPRNGITIICDVYSILEDHSFWERLSQSELLSPVNYKLLSLYFQSALVWVVNNKYTSFT